MAAENHVGHPNVTAIIHEKASDYVAEGAPEFELQEGLTKIRNVIFDKTETALPSLANNYIMQLYTWALVLMMINHQARKSDFSDEHVRAA